LEQKDSLIMIVNIILILFIVCTLTTRYFGEDITSHSVYELLDEDYYCEMTDKNDDSIRELRFDLCCAAIRTCDNIYEDNNYHCENNNYHYEFDRQTFINCMG